MHGEWSWLSHGHVGFDSSSGGKAGQLLGCGRRGVRGDDHGCFSVVAGGRVGKGGLCKYFRGDLKV